MNGLIYSARFARAGSVFHPGLGFLLRDNYSHFGGNIGYGLQLGPSSRLLRHTFSMSGDLYSRNSDGSTASAVIAPQWKLEAKSGRTLTLTMNIRREDVNEVFEVAGIDIPAGTYDFWDGQLTYTPKLSNTLRTSATVEYGQYFDGHRFSFSLSPWWSPSRYLNLTAFYRLDHLTFPGRGLKTNAHVARLRAEVMFSTELSTAAFVQYNNVAHAVSSNFRIRYNPREGNDLYLVYNHGVNTDRSRFTPTLPVNDSWTILVKYTYTFNFGI